MNYVVGERNFQWNNTNQSLISMRDFILDSTSSEFLKTEDDPKVVGQSIDRVFLKATPGFKKKKNVLFCVCY